MKKLILALGVLAMTTGAVADSGRAQQDLSLEDLIRIVIGFKDAVEDKKDRTDNPKPPRRKLVVETYSIPVNRREVLRGESVIQIRKALKEQGVNLEGKAIRSVGLRAKSRHGRGKVSLQVGRFDTEEKRIEGRPRAFDRKGPRTMHNLALKAPVTVREQLSRGGVKGPIRLNLRGNIKVGKVMVEVVRKRRR
ncbi:MAG: hypothetical protein ACRBBP_08940 [Bdellovibrionales bacterium]